MDRYGPEEKPLAGGENLQGEKLRGYFRHPPLVIGHPYGLGLDAEALVQEPVMLPEGLAYNFV